jgi:hypothetical protein
VEGYNYLSGSYDTRAFLVTVTDRYYVGNQFVPFKVQNRNENS